MMGTYIVIVGLVAAVAWQQARLIGISKAMAATIELSEELINRLRHNEQELIGFAKGVQQGMSTLEDNVQVLALGMKGSVEAMMVQGNEITKITTLLKESN